MTGPRRSGRVVTLTANPSLDRTLELPGPLVQGGIVRLAGTSTEPGGKGVNVARAIAAAGGDVVSILPAAASDPIVTALRGLGLELATVPVRAPVRTNYTLVDPAGTTTKLNEPGAPLTETSRGALSGVLHGHAAAAEWVVLSGSLPPSTPADWYADLVRSLRDTGARIAVDTSEAPLVALLAAGPDAAPDLLKPNAEELAQLAALTEDDVLHDPAAMLAAVRSLHDRGVAEVLLTLGADGALLSTADGELWSARPPRVTVRSTVGAGDCSLAGHLLASLAGEPPAERLRNAVAYGAASASLPGSAVPTPAQVDGPAVRVTAGLPGSTNPIAPNPVPAAGRDAL
ncbi:1-phosphofructokinase family hexose kinase [Blastococcus sp. MG754426]|uniref:1-phosphofructokinase family hexose kinase n=1 Tax=unclassified Blastococcus TaxID=2619396 RepID=UPI001EEFBBFA|nr:MULTISPECIES: 1-phosphofructokinase family hexose kinase [unclassified Blastococcus]MCF6509236.1 1-phosphofructokinase family hexose kinase [Blastococcus sp. MG754426]MCF6513804.1 1-phosphofructokinase family hexose kinase [Blastococcus sp. MG754427]MCF6736576.1 1-phosphofructokinase family hexose kinase [Blastococcus sp. KM273129]